MIHARRADTLRPVIYGIGFEARSSRRPHRVGEAGRAGAVLERVFRYQRMWAEGEHYEMFVEGERARVTYEQYGPERPAHVQMAQMSFCDFVVNGSRYIPGLEFECVRFRHGEPPEAAEYARVFGVPVEFGAAFDESPGFWAIRIPARSIARSSVGPTRCPKPGVARGTPPLIVSPAEPAASRPTT